MMAIKLFNVNIYKVIILIGTFALALAFAGNDLVNFIGVPIAGWQSYEAWIQSGIPADKMTMDILSKKVETPNLILLFAGTIMVITLWFSARAKNVLKTSIDLSDQSEIQERFKANFLAKILVQFFEKVNSLVQKLSSENFKEKIENRFIPANQLLLSNTIIEKPAFDMVRASVNLIVASILISIATSYKLPLSTTYVTFMVAMGTSLSDRAWGSESAVYRVSGVLNVIGGWFITAIVAFLAAGLVAFLMNWNNIFIPILFLVTCYIIYRNYKNYNIESKKIKLENEKLENEKNTLKGVIKEGSKNIKNVIKRSNKIYSNIADGIARNDLKLLKKNSNQITKLKDEVDELQENIFVYLKKEKRSTEQATKLYLVILNKLTEITTNLQYISKKSFKHVEKDKRKLALSQIKNILSIEGSFQNIFKEVTEIFGERKYDKIEALLIVIIKLKNEISNQVSTLSNSDVKSKNETLNLEILEKSSMVLVSLKELLENFYSMNSES